MPTAATTSRTTILDWYGRYVAAKGKCRNDLLDNPEVLFQALAFDKSIINALRSVELDRGSSKVLDVGCSRGGSLLTFLRLEYEPSNLYGIDIRQGMIAEAQRRFPVMHFSCQDAAQLSFDDGLFDITTESTMFVQITEDHLAQNIASEMLRVTKPGGYIVLIDWRYSKPGNTDYKGVSRRRIADLFGVGKYTTVQTRTRGALVPPLGRALSRYASMLYFLTQALCPPCVGQVTTVLKKSSRDPAIRANLRRGELSR